jgi:hypothetical protein
MHPKPSLLRFSLGPIFGCGYVVIGNDCTTNKDRNTFFDETSENISNLNWLFPVRDGQK